MDTIYYRFAFLEMIGIDPKREDITDFSGVSMRTHLTCMAIVACVFLTQAVSSQIPSRPNILLLMAEDMSARVGAFGDGIAVTPNLETLAAEGVI